MGVWKDSHPNQSPPECRQEGYLGEPLIDPIIEYPNSRNPIGGIGVAVIGGHVYRGSHLPQLDGRYVFGDWSRSFAQPEGTLLMATRPESGQGLWPIQELRLPGYPNQRLGRYVLGFGQDLNGEMYVLTTRRTAPTGDTGRVFKITQPGDMNDDGCVDDKDSAAVLRAFGSTGSGLPADLNNDEVVDNTDLTVALFGFGRC